MKRGRRKRFCCALLAAALAMAGIPASGCTEAFAEELEAVEDAEAQGPADARENPGEELEAVTLEDGEESAIEAYEVLTVSTEQPAQFMTFYKYEGKFYLTASDIGRLTRFTAVMDPQSIRLKQGKREITIDPAAGTIEEEWGIFAGCRAVPYGAYWLLEAVPMLTYLGAECSYEDQVFSCEMPMYTLWEIWDNEYSASFMNVETIFGNDLEARMLNNIVMDAIFGSGMSGLGHQGQAYFNDAMDAVMKVNVLDSEAVYKEYSRLEARRAQACSTEGLDGQQEELAERALVGNAYGGLEKGITAAKTGSTVLNMMKKYLKKQGEGASFEDVLEGDALIPTDELMKLVPELKLELAKTMLDVLVTAEVYCNYDEEIRTLPKRVFGAGALEKIGYSTGNRGYSDWMNQYLRRLEDRYSAQGQLTIEKVSEKVLDICLEKGMDYIAQAFSVGGGLELFKKSWDIGVGVVKIVQEEIVESAAAELKAMFISELQGNTANILWYAVNTAKESGFGDRERNQQLLDTANIYYRETVAFCENILKNIGLTQKNEEYFSAVKREAEKKVFQYSNCPAFAVSVYAGLEDNVLRGKVDSGQQTAADSGYTAYGYVLASEGSLYYMRFTLESLSGRMTVFCPREDAEVELVRRWPDGREEVVDRITGNNAMGLCGTQIMYSRQADGSEKIQCMDTQSGARGSLERGVMQGATGSAIAYYDKIDGVLYGYGAGGEECRYNAEYVGMDGDYLYLQVNDCEPYSIGGGGTMQIGRQNLRTLETETVTSIPEIYSENMGTTVLTQFMADGGDTYYGLVRLTGTQGLYTDGVIYRVKQGESSPEVLAENTTSEFQLMKNGGKTYLLYDLYDTDGVSALLEVESRTVDGSFSQKIYRRGRAVWDTDGICAYLDMSGTKYTILTSEEIYGLGFSGYMNDCRISDVSLQEDGAYVYVCRGTQEYNGTAPEFSAVHVALVRKNLETGELTVIYEEKR